VPRGAAGVNRAVHKGEEKMNYVQECQIGVSNTERKIEVKKIELCELKKELRFWKRELKGAEKWEKQNG
jgi:hypothetical protein